MCYQKEICNIFPFFRTLWKSHGETGHALMSLQPQEGVSISLTAQLTHTTKKRFTEAQKNNSVIWHFVCTHPQIYEFLFLYVQFCHESKMSDWSVTVKIWSYLLLVLCQICFLLLKIKKNFFPLDGGGTAKRYSSQE